MNRPLLLRRVAIAAIAAGMLGAALGMVDGPAVPARPSTLDASSGSRQAAGSPTDAPPANASAPPKPTRITELSGELGPPTSGAEVGPYRVTKYAIDKGAIAVTFDPDTDVLSVLFPLGSDPPPPPETEMNVSVRTASFPTAAYDAAADDLTSFAWSPDARKYGYAISLDAATALVTVETDAPAEVTDILEERHPGIFRFEQGGPIRFLPLPAGASR